MAIKGFTLLVLLYHFSCLVLNGEQPLISKGPYIQSPSSNSMTIMWESPVNLPATVFYGIGENLSKLEVKERKRASSSLGALLSSTNFYIYKARINGLQPATTYSYFIQIGNTNTPVKKFRTFPVHNEKVKFIVYGDTRSNPDIHKKLASHFKSFSPEFILHTGDLVSRGSRYQVWGREFFFPLENVIDEIPIFPVIGNHEEKSENYFNYFDLPNQKSYYSFQIGPLFILALDYHFQKNTDDQYKFAQRALESTKAPWKIVTVHVPMFNIGGHFSGWGHKYYLPLFHKTGVDLVIAGHSHIYERFYPIAPAGKEPLSPITHITTGGGGAPLATSYSHPALAVNARTNHFLYFEITPTNLLGACFDINGRTLDRFEIKKQNGTYDSNYIAQIFPEEQARLSLEVMTNLVTRAVSLPTSQTPTLIMFRLVPLTTISTPVQMQLQLTPESAKYYTVLSDNLTVSTPPPDGEEKIVWVKVIAKPGVTVREGKNRELVPHLIFNAIVSDENTKTITYGRPAYISSTAIKEAEKSGKSVD